MNRKEKPGWEAGQRNKQKQDKDNTIYRESNLNIREIYLKEFDEYAKTFPKGIPRQELIDNFWWVFSLKHLNFSKSGEVIWQ